MSSISVFAVFYDPVSGIVTRKVFLDKTVALTDDALKTMLVAQAKPTERVIFIPSHQRTNVAQYLTMLGIKLVA